MRLGISRIALVGCLAVSACAATPAILPAPMDVPHKAAPDASSAQANATGGAPATRITTTPKPPAADLERAMKPRSPDSASPTEEATIVLVFEQVPLPTFVQVVYGKTLGRNVTLDPAVATRKDLVTLRSGSMQTPSQVAETMRLLLKSYGIAVVDSGNLVRIVPDTAGLGYLPEIRRGRALPETPQSLRPIFQLVELRAVRNTEVASWIRTMFDKRVDLKEDAGRNAVLLGGAADDVAAAMDAIFVLDQPLMRGRHSIRITPVFWSADEMGKRLTDILQAEGYGASVPSGSGIGAPVVLLPVAGANAVFAFASDERILDHIAAWAKELDKPNEKGAGRNLFSYKVENTDAELLARTLQQLMSGSAAAGAPAGGGAGASAAAGPSTSRIGNVIVDRGSNTLIFAGRGEDYGDIRNLLQSLDKPAKGALIEVTVAEVSLTDNSQLGVEWLATESGLSGGRSATYGTLGGLSIGSAGFNYRLFNSVGELRLLLNALASSNRATILSSPRVVARNGENATIQVGQEVPIITTQQVAASGGGILLPNNVTTVPQSVQYRTTGVILNVKPVIYAGDRIDLDVSQEVSIALPTTTGVSTSPTFSTRKVQTRLSLRNGATVLLGGLIGRNQSDGDAGIPFLKDIPLLGQAFRTNTTKNERTELIVLITPYIIADDNDARAITDAFRNQLGTWARESPGVAP